MVGVLTHPRVPRAENGEGAKVSASIEHRSHNETLSYTGPVSIEAQVLLQQMGAKVGRGCRRYCS
jgi:hypothetical protein